ncbi:hypothetical protein A2721_00410 [Candidatus Gottesmanbacteria bacterium RIFCSPHIGHO2_01_FULL_47_48]|uniref:Gfo/Idh/MocA-like oxidoreductase N-terminal domain-containing protein n=1 Tax=Candidatus Gottesmanbacteria bacterium RIFCSPHIGHO2_01_FULL_47_48 TaxID=1798381 RepID=A0A1F6A1A7_9BACT|nr:MAG: hypothetical protein A2721_00410 [Candidatus Gottesmanbacteria bacterium RIFCSPHIGHO2_01_FULL_47_48]
MQKIKTAIIGCGRVSRFHAVAYQKISGVQLRSGVDVAQERRDWFSKTFSVKIYSSLEELLDEDKPDLISLCTPSYLHFSQAKKIIEAGVNLIIEKPVSLTKGQGEVLLAVEKRSRVVISTCFQNRFNPAVQLLTKYVRSGKMGKILIGNVCVRWFRTPDYFINHWHGLKKQSGGGALMTQSIHQIDLLRVLMGTPSEINGFTLNLRSYSDVEDVVVACMKYPLAVSSIECSTVAYPKDVEASITIIGENGTIKIGGKSLNKVEYGFVGKKEIKTVPDSEDPTTVYGTSHILLVKNVVNAIIHKSVPAVSLLDGVESLNLVNQIYTSLSKCSPDFN